MPLNEWVKNEAISATKLNETVNAINKNLPINGGPNVLVQANKGGGTSISINGSNAGLSLPVVGEIVTAGPAAEADYTDCRYWIKISENRITSVNKLDTDELDLQALPTEALAAKRIVTAYNLNEYADASHTLAENTRVMIMRLMIDSPQAAGLTPQFRWFVVGGAGGGLPVPQYQYMTMQAVTQNALGADWTRSHL